jgi:hypothetical protein
MTESNATVGLTEGPMESTVSKPKPLLKCSHCGKTFSTRKLSVLQAHERMHTGELPFECLEIGCNKRFSRKDSMMVHYLKHARVHSCTVKSCRMTFGSAIDLFRHQRFHQIQCSTCGISCETVPLLRMHKLKAHNESDFKCSVGENVLPLVTRNPQRDKLVKYCWMHERAYQSFIEQTLLRNGNALVCSFGLIDVFIQTLQK